MFSNEAEEIQPHRSRRPPTGQSSSLPRDARFCSVERQSNSGLVGKFAVAVDQVLIQLIYAHCGILSLLPLALVGLCGSQNTSDDFVDLR